MTSILVVCTGNICRSPIAEGMIRNALAARFAGSAPTVSSAGTWGVEGAEATPEAIKAAAERGVIIRQHRARRLSTDMTRDADLVLVMGTEHREALRQDPEVAGRTFTLKELVRLLESLPPAQTRGGAGGLAERVAAANAARTDGFDGNPLDEDVADPIGLPLQSYRAIAWELDEWIVRLIDGLYGADRVAAAHEA